MSYMVAIDKVNRVSGRQQLRLLLAGDWEDVQNCQSCVIFVVKQDRA